MQGTDWCYQTVIIGLLFFPESPRYLVEKDRPDEAMKVLRKLHYDGTNDEWIQAEFNEITLTIQAEKAITAPGWLVMFKIPVSTSFVSTSRIELSVLQSIRILLTSALGLEKASHASTAVIHTHP